MPNATVPGVNMLGAYKLHAAPIPHRETYRRSRSFSPVPSHQLSAALPTKTTPWSDPLPRKGVPLRLPRANRVQFVVGLLTIKQPDRVSRPVSSSQPLRCSTQPTMACVVAVTSPGLRCRVPAQTTIPWRASRSDSDMYRRDHVALSRRPGHVCTQCSME